MIENGVKIPTRHGDQGAPPEAVQGPGVLPVLGKGAVHEARAARQRRKLRAQADQLHDCLSYNV